MSTIDALSEDIKKLIVEYTKPYYVYSLFVIDTTPNKHRTHLLGNYSTLKKAVHIATSDYKLYAKGKPPIISNIPWYDSWKNNVKYFKSIERTVIDEPLGSGSKTYTKLPTDLDDVREI